MEDNLDFENKPVHEISTSPERRSIEDHPMTGKKMFFTMAIIGLIAGMIGGLYGALNLANRPEIQRLFNHNGAVNGQTINQNLTLSEDSAITEVVKKSSPAVVSIVISKNISSQNSFDPFGFGFGGDANNSQQSSLQEVGAGSGFFVSKDGLILTNKHVVSDKGAKYTVLTSDGKKYDATVVAVDPSNDFAIVKVDISDAPYLNFADSNKLQLGEHVIAIGNSLGQFQNTVTSGVVSGLSRNIVAGDRTGQEQLEGIIQTDAAINPGNSGGPLLNYAGQVVGINTAVSSEGQGVGFAIPSNDAKVALDSYNRDGKIVRPFLGVRYMLISKAIADQQKLPRDHGALIIRGDTATDFAVVPGSPADRAGLKENDIILEVNGQEINEDNSLTYLLKSYKPGDTVNLKVYSNGSEKSMPLILGQTN